MKIYKYKVAMMVAAAWFIATALFCTIPSVWQAVVATVLALVPLMRYEHETRRNEKIRAVAFALIVVLCNICVLTLTHHHV